MIILSEYNTWALMVIYVIAVAYSHVVSWFYVKFYVNPLKLFWGKSSQIVYLKRIL